MSEDFHMQLLVEARADQAALQELGAHIGVLHDNMSTARKADVDGVRREFELLHEQFEALHRQDMHRNLDQVAHQSWRARVKSLTERVDELVGAAGSQ